MAALRGVPDSFCHRRGAAEATALSWRFSCHATQRGAPSLCLILVFHARFVRRCSWFGRLTTNSKRGFVFHLRLCGDDCLTACRCICGLRACATNAERNEFRRRWRHARCGSIRQAKIALALDFGFCCIDERGVWRLGMFVVLLFLLISRACRQDKNRDQKRSRQRALMVTDSESVQDVPSSVRLSEMSRWIIWLVFVLTIPLAGVVFWLAQGLSAQSLVSVDYGLAMFVLLAVASFNLAVRPVGARMLFAFAAVVVGFTVFVSTSVYLLPTLPLRPVSLSVAPNLGQCMFVKSVRCSAFRVQRC